jgi:hypothetical protein
MPPPIARRKFGFALAVFFRRATIDANLGTCPESSRPGQPDSPSKELARFRGVRPNLVFPVLWAANRHEYPPFEIGFFITAQTVEFPLCIHRYVRFFPFRLALLRALTMRPAPLAPSAFPAPPKEFLFKSFAPLTAAIG